MGHPIIHPQLPIPFTIPDATAPAGVASVSPIHFAGNNNVETSATSPILATLRPYTVSAYSLLAMAVVLGAFNDPYGSAGALGNLDGNIAIGAPSAHFTFVVAFLWRTILRAVADRPAGVHDNIKGSSSSHAWKPTSRHALLDPLVLLLEVTGMSLRRPGSGTHTPDS